MGQAGGNANHDYGEVHLVPVVLQVAGVIQDQAARNHLWRRARQLERVRREALEASACDAVREEEECQLALVTISQVKMLVKIISVWRIILLPNESGPYGGGARHRGASTLISETCIQVLSIEINNCL